MSQTMSNEIQNIHYCTILSAGQWDFLLEGRFSPLRQKCLFRLMNGAVRTRTAYKIKGIDIVLEVGQVAASDVELAEFLDCNRKTVGKLIARFNRLGMLTTRTNNRTSVHSLHFLTGWYVGGVLITNPHYVRPSATAKGQTGDVRTPVSDSLPSGDELEAAAVDCHTRGKEASTLEGRIVKISDRIAYINHDIDDAQRAGVLLEKEIPEKAVKVLGASRTARINTLVHSLVENSRGGELAMEPRVQEAFDELHAFMYGHVYHNPCAKGEEKKVPELVEQLFDFFMNNPQRLPDQMQLIAYQEGLVRAVCDHVAGMTDHFAVQTFTLSLIHI